MPSFNETGIYLKLIQVVDWLASVTHGSTTVADVLSLRNGSFFSHIYLKQTLQSGLQFHITCYPWITISLYLFFSSLFLSFLILPKLYFLLFSKKALVHFTHSLSYDCQEETTNTYGNQINMQSSLENILSTAVMFLGLK